MNKYNFLIYFIFFIAEKKSLKYTELINHKGVNSWLILITQLLGLALNLLDDYY